MPAAVKTARVRLVSEPYDKRTDSGSFAPSVPDDEILALYRLSGSVAKVSQACGLAPRSVRDRLQKLRKQGLLKPTEAAPKPVIRRDITTVSDDEIWAQYELTPNVDRVAERLGVSAIGVRERLAEIRIDRAPVTQESPNAAGALEKLLVSVPPEDPQTGAPVKEIHVKLHEGFYKDEFTQSGVKVPMDGVSAKYVVVNPDPEFPLAQPGPPVSIKYVAAPRILRKTRVIVIPSDAQIGWLRHPETLAVSPIHDPTAMDVCKQIVVAVSPDGIVFIGDWMDWQFLSRWTQHNEFDTVNLSIKTGTEELASFCSAGGKRAADHIFMIGSNHQARPEKFLLENNKAAMRIRRGGDTSQWPVFSEQYLLHYDDLGVKFSGQYPGGEHYITPELVAMHAPPKAKEFDADVFHGHTHHLRMSPYVLHSHAGRKERFVWDTGCLCRTDATTDKARMMVTNTPSNQPRTDWIQGCAVINIVEGKFPLHSVDLIHIKDGRALYRQQEFRASKESVRLLKAA